MLYLVSQWSSKLVHFTSLLLLMGWLNTKVQAGEDHFHKDPPFWKGLSGSPVKNAKVLHIHPTWYLKNPKLPAFWTISNHFPTIFLPKCVLIQERYLFFQPFSYNVSFFASCRSGRTSVCLRGNRDLPNPGACCDFFLGDIFPARMSVEQLPPLSSEIIDLSCYLLKGYILSPWSVKIISWRIPIICSMGLAYINLAKLGRFGG